LDGRFSGYGAEPVDLFGLTMYRMRWFVGIAGVVLLAALAIVVSVRTGPRPSPEWKEFAVGPASGRTIRIARNSIHADGASLLTLVAWAHRLPETRVIGPEALHVRYSIEAEIGGEDQELLRGLVARELRERLRLASHVEPRPFDVWVLTAEKPSLQPAAQPGPSITVLERNANTTGSIATLATALQGILGKPVVDETGLRGEYSFEFAWGEQRDQSLVAAMRNKFGLLLSPGKRDLEALIVDEVRPDFAMKVFSGVGWATRHAPAGVRRGLARALTFR